MISHPLDIQSGVHVYFAHGQQCSVSIDVPITPEILAELDNHLYQCSDGQCDRRYSQEMDAHSQCYLCGAIL